MSLAIRAATTLRRGQTVTIRSQHEILRTLDADGKLDGLPFMPEMAQYCGRTARVFRRADKVFLDHRHVARMKGTVLLEGLRCDGAAHGGCQMQCMLLWKEAWLCPAPAEAEGEHDESPAGPIHDASQLPTSSDRGFCCQATELAGATTRLRCWEPGQYWRDWSTGELSLREIVAELGLLVGNRLRWLCGCEAHGTISGNGRTPPDVRLNLRPGELVQVKTPEEIAGTLDAGGKTRGLAFTPEMSRHCGRQYRVAGRVRKIIAEWSGVMHNLPDTVILEDVNCLGVGARRCPRNCYLLWREAWLKRTACATGQTSPPETH